MESISDCLSYVLNRFESPIEKKLFAALRDLGIAPRVQYPIGVFRADMAYEDEKLTIECDGRQYHTGERHVSKDRYRDKRLKELGWKVIRYPGWLINRYPEACAAEIGLKYMPGKLSPEATHRAKAAVITYGIRTKT
jgi:very-short-patch-repair endonuclease